MLNSAPALMAVLAAFVLLVPDAGAERITTASYDQAIHRYGHFAAGRPHEYARLLARTDEGSTIAFELPDDEVFEDVAPRIVRFAPGAAPELLTVVSSRRGGARLAVIGLAGRQLELRAQSRAIGTPMRWLNPVGVVDLDGDGRAELAAVTTPHIGGTLRIYRRKDGELVEVAALAGFSNHVYGSSELRLSTFIAIEGQTRLLVPDSDRRRLAVLALIDDRIVELGRCELRGQVTGPITIVAPDQVAVDTAAGPQVVAPQACR